MKLTRIVKKSIRNQIISGVAVILAIIVIFTSLYYPAKLKSISLEKVQAQVETLGEMLAFSVGMGLGESNFTLVTTTFNWAQKDKNVTYILIQDEKKEEIVAYNPKNLKIDIASVKEKNKIVMTDNDVTIHSPIKYNNTHLGQLTLVYSLNSVNETIASNVTTSVIISLAIFFVGIILIWWITKIITSKINGLNYAAKQVAAGNLEVNIDIKSEDEIGILADSFKKMTQSIKDGNDLLVKEKESIAVKVEEAVKESEEQKQYLSGSIENILVEMNKFAKGDLTVQLDIEKDDEIGKLYSGFNSAVTNIKEMIVSTTEAVQATASASHEISSSTEEMAAGSQEQSAQTSEVASAVEQMTSTILSTTKNASSAAEFSKKAGQSAINGGQVVKQTVEGMNRIAKVVGDAASTVKELGNSSNQIGEIIQVIDDIADQTNLLALNAAIEAARAGEQGRGFAVVADEVRKLAERTTKATKEIASMIKQIQKDTGNAVESIESGTKEVETGKELAKKAIEALDEIIGSTNETIDVVNQVAAASEEQSSAAEQISKSIESISSVTNETASGIQQIARASEDLSNLTTNLQNLVSKFKIVSEENNRSRNQNKQFAVRPNGKLIGS